MSVRVCIASGGSWEQIKVEKESCKVILTHIWGMFLMIYGLVFQLCHFIFQPLYTYITTSVCSPCRYTSTKFREIRQLHSKGNFGQR